MISHSIPIVMAAFGTTTRAMNTYSFIDKVCKERFPGHDLYWAFSSRIVKDQSKQRHNTNMQHPHQVLSKLREMGHEWAVVQSLHLMWGHEFYRLVDEVADCGIRTSMGLPLLSEPKDYKEAVGVMSETFRDPEDEAVVLVGHGTDHPSWCSYVALNHIFREKIDSGIFVGVVEDGYPSMRSVVQEVRETGYRRVRIIPFMLVAGMHFEEDLSGGNGSWQFAFEEEGIAVSLDSQGLGFYSGIIELYCRHIEEALDVIPIRKEGALR